MTNTLSDANLRGLLNDEKIRQSHSFDNVTFDIGARSLEIRNLALETSYVLETDDELATVSFIDCTFQLLFMGGVSSLHSKTFIFTGCSFHSLSCLGDNQLNLLIRDSLKLDDLLIAGGLSTLELSNNNSDAAEIKMLEISDRIQSSDASLSVSRVSIVDQVIGMMSVDRMQVGVMVIDGTHIRALHCSHQGENQVEFSANCQVNDMYFQSFEGKLSIIECVLGRLHFISESNDENLESKSFLRIADTSINELAINNSAKLGSVELHESCRVKSIRFEHGAVRVIQISCSLIHRLDVNISKFRFDQMLVHNPSSNQHINQIILRDGYLGKGVTSNLSVVQFSGFSFSSLVFSSFTNLGSVFISGVSGGSPVKVDFPEIVVDDYFLSVLHYKLDFFHSGLYIHNSDLGKVNLISCIFGSLTLDFLSSKVIEVFLAGTEMPIRVVGDRQLAYGQLKKMYENRGDSIKSLEYLKMELESQFELLSAIPRKSRTLEERHERFVLLLGKYSNRFGTSYKNWWIVMIFMVVLFCAHNWELGYHLEWSEAGRDNFATILSLLPEFLFPIHKADFIAEKLNTAVTPISRVIDVLARVVSGYFIYQYVQVFRKYGKK